MLTKKKGSKRAAARDQNGSRVSRAQKKLSANIKESEKKVTDSDYIFSKKAKPWQDCNEGTDDSLLETIFSPTFHIAKHADEETTGDVQGANISSEFSAIYLAMKNSKLECVDQHGQDPMSTDGYVEDEDYEEFDDLDPYLFLKNLPALSSVPTFWPMLLPKQIRNCPPTTLILDLNRAHSLYVRCRPCLRDLLESVANLFESIIFTARQSIYAEQFLNVLNPKRKIFRHCVYLDSCVYVDGNYLKDLTILGRDLAHVIIIDNSPQAFGFQVDNGIPIESLF